MLYLIIFCVIICIIFKSQIFRICIGVVLLLITFYTNICNMIMYILPKYMYVETYEHRTCKLDFSIHHYKIKYNNKYKSIKLIDDNVHLNYKNIINKIIKNIDKLEYNKNNMINHCCIMSLDGEYIRDITNDIRMFIHYIGKIDWEYILVHLDINTEYNILISINDDELTEKILYVRDISEEIFNL